MVGRESGLVWGVLELVEGGMEGRGGAYSSWEGEGVVDVEEADGVFEGAGLEGRVNSAGFGHGGLSCLGACNDCFLRLIVR